MWKRLKAQIIRWQGIEVTAIGVTLMVMALQSTGALQFLECVVLDQWFRFRPFESRESRIVIVTIDEADLLRFRRWPISDATLALVLNKIKQQQAKVIGLDLYRNLPVEPGQKELQQVYASTPNLIGIKTVLSGAIGPVVDPPQLLSQLNQVAPCDLIVEPDGKIRRYLLSVRLFGDRKNGRKPQTSLTLGAKLALSYLEARNIRLEKNGNDGILKLGKAKFVPLQENEGGFTHADVGGYQILANFHKSQQGVTKVSITDVLEDRIPTKLLQGKVVLIGSVAESLKARFYTPYTTAWSAVEVHADLVNQILSAALDNRQLLRGISLLQGWIWVLLWSSVGAALGWEINSQRVRLAPQAVRVPSGSLLGWIIVLFPSAIASLFISTYLLFLLGWWVTLVSPLLGLVAAGFISRGYLLWRGLQLSHQALANYTQTLELEVQQRTQQLIEKNLALEKSKLEAESANIAKSTFLANISHELRTPLNAILGFSEILGREDVLTAQQIKHVEIINRSGKHLLELINDVLSMSKIEAGRTILVEKTFDLYLMLDSIQEMLQLRADSKGLIFKFELAENIPKYIHSDESKLRQILINLLGNAIKFTPQGSVILRVRLVSNRESDLTFDSYSQLDENQCIPQYETAIIGNKKSTIVIYKSRGNNNIFKHKISFSTESNLQNNCRQTEKLFASNLSNESSQLSYINSKFSYLSFEISDTGIGIGTEELNTLFNPFVQTESGRRSMEGTGLGLAISQEFVRLLGGDITVSSIINRGSIFSFDIKVSFPDENYIETKRPNQEIIGLAPNQSNYRILVVEDVEENRLLLVKLLEPLGFEVREAVNGYEAVQIWQSWQPHLIFMDIKMPAMNGYEATKRIRILENQRYDEASNCNFSVTKTISTIIIALTASTFEEHQSKFLRAGCNDFIGKPFSKNLLYEKIAMHLNVRYLYQHSQSNLIEEVVSFQLIIAEKLNIMPKEWIKKLHYAAISLNDQLAIELIEQIPEHETALSRSLYNLIDNFRLDIIATCIDNQNLI